MNEPVPTRREVPPKFARDAYNDARKKVGLPPHPAKEWWDKKQSDKAK